MNFVNKLTDDEKKIIVQILKDHLKEIKEDKKLPNTNVQMIAAEVRYETVLKNIVDKLS